MQNNTNAIKLFRKFAVYKLICSFCNMKSNLFFCISIVLLFVFFVFSYLNIYFSKFDRKLWRVYFKQFFLDIHVAWDIFMPFFCRNLPVKSFVMDFSQQHVIFIHSGIAGENFSEFSYICRLIHAHANLNLPRLLRGVENVYIKIYLTMVLRYWYWHA